MNRNRSRRLFSLCVLSGLLASSAVAVDSAEAQRKRRKKSADKPPAAAAAEADANAEGASDSQAEEPAPMEVSPEEIEQAESAASDESGAPADAQASAAQESASDAPPVDAAKTEKDAELTALRGELAAVMDELVQARALVAMLGKALFKTRVRVMVEDRAMPDQVVGKIALYLDGAPVFRGDGAAIPSDPAHSVFEGFAAPGSHELTLELEHRARDDEDFRYSVRNRFRFEVVREHRTDLRIVIEDDSDMADDFPDDHEGEYEVETRLEVNARPLGEE